MSKRELHQINAGSMADIAFLLLIFFLVSTTMDVDTGISRILPPMPETQDQIDETKVKERNILVVLIDRKNRLMVEGELFDIKNLKEKTKEFFLNTEKKADLPEIRLVDVDFFGLVEVSKGIISLQNDRGTSYEMYITVQNELAAAVHELQNELSLRTFGIKFDDLPKEKQSAIKKIHWMALSEAEPKDIGGK